MAWFLLDEDNDIELEFDDDVPEEEALAWYEQSPLLSDANPYGYITNTDVVVGPGQLPPPKYVVDPELERSSILPVGYNPETGEKEWALPEFAADWAQGTYNVLGAIGGKHELTDEQFMDSAIMATLPVGVAQAPRKAAAGTFQSFLGPKAKGFDPSMAEKWLAQGVEPKKVFQETGYFKGLQGEWIQYKPNKSFIEGTSAIDKIVGDPTFAKLDKGITLKLKQILPKDDPIVQAYGEEILNIPVTLKPYTKSKKSGGSFKPSGAIEIRAGSPETAKTALIHEVQHAIQAKEGWVQGSSRKAFFDEHSKASDLADPNRMKALANDFGIKWDKKLPPQANIQEIRKALDSSNLSSKERTEIYNYLQQELKTLAKARDKRHPGRMYETNYGEVMARIAENWAAAPQGGTPFDNINLQRSLRSYEGLDPLRTLRKEDVHFKEWDKEAWAKRLTAEQMDDMEEKMILPDSFGEL